MGPWSVWGEAAGGRAMACERCRRVTYEYQPPKTEWALNFLVHLFLKMNGAAFLYSIAYVNLG